MNSEVGEGNFCYPLGFSPLIWQTDLSARVDGREEERKKDGFSDCQKLSAAFLPSLPPIVVVVVVPFLFFQPALINEANQLAAAERETAEMGSLRVGRTKYPMC